MNRANDILHAVELRIRHRDVNGRLPCQMHDGIERTLIEHIIECRARHIDLATCYPIRQVFPPPSAEVINDRDILSRLLQQTDQMRADKARASRHQDLHR